MSSDRYYWYRQALSSGTVPLTPTIDTQDNCFSEEILEKVIKPSFKGEVIVGMAGGEASGSTDFQLHSATAKREGDEYVINASKIMITHADEQMMKLSINYMPLSPKQLMHRERESRK